jgi:chemotaxis family two-component system response regulator PixG
MKADNTSQKMIVPELTGPDQAKLFHNFKQKGYSGQVLLKDAKGSEWIFYMYMGRIIYASGGPHSVRRWKRNLAIYLPENIKELEVLDQAVVNAKSEGHNLYWEYDVLCLLVAQEKASRQQMVQMIQNIILELYFDFNQVKQLTISLLPEQTASKQLVPIDSEPLIVASWKKWQAWQSAKLREISPNVSPVIKQKEILRVRTSPQIYQTLIKLLDGTSSLREIAVKMKKDLVPVTTSLLPYIQSGLVELVDTPDLISPLRQIQAKERENSPLIACVDDSPAICQNMKKILTQAGYRFVGINDDLRAIAVLLSKKPDLIFLDLVMPNTNGYEICSQLRKISIFRDTPVIILTGNDTVIDRVRSKMVGCTDFLGKPVDAQTVLDTIAKYLAKNRA